MVEQRKVFSPGKAARAAGGTNVLLLAFCFLLGAVIGLCFHLWWGNNAALSGYLNDYLDFAAQGDLRFSLAGVIWRCVRWPLLVFLLGMFGDGTVLIPAAF